MNIRDNQGMVSLVITLVLHSFLAISLSSCVYYRTALEAEYQKQGNIAYADENYALALDYYEKYRKINRNKIAQYKIIEIKIILAQFEESRKALDALMKRDKKNLLVQELSAYWYYATGDIETALAQYLMIIETMPHNSRILGNIGIIYAKQGDNSSSVSYFTRAFAQSDKSILPSVDILEQYIQVLITISQSPQAQESTLETPKETPPKLERSVEFYLRPAIASFLAHTENQLQILFSWEKLGDMLRIPFPKYAFIVYKKISETIVSLDELRERNLRNLSFFTLASMIYTKEYVPVDIDAYEYAFFSLSNALEGGYGDRNSEIVNLKKLWETLTLESPQVLQKNIATLYFDNEIFTEREYKDIIDN